MGAVKDVLITLTEKVINELPEIEDDDDMVLFDAVEEFIMDHVPWSDVVMKISPTTIAEEFRRYNICPQCLTLTHGKTCSCFTLERL